MSKKCDLCGRTATKGASRSHSKIKTLKRQNINLQSRTIGGVKLKVCITCLRTLNKPKRVKAKRKPPLKEGEVKALKVKKAKTRKPKKNKVIPQILKEATSKVLKKVSPKNLKKTTVKKLKK